jgi:hypothetical protein
MHRKQLQQMVRDALKNIRGITPTFNKGNFTVAVSNADTAVLLRRQVADALKGIGCVRSNEDTTEYNVLWTYSYPLAQAA